MKVSHQEKIWTKSFISISLTQFLMFTVFYALLTTLPIYVIDHLGESESTSGLVVSSMLIAAIIIRPFSAKILEILGKKKGLIMSIALFTVTTFLYIWVKTFIPLLVVRFMHGISFGLVSTATGAIVADILPEARKGEGMGYFAMAMNLAIVAGPFIGLTVIQLTSYQLLFIILSGCMLLSVFFSWLVRVKDVRVGEKRKEAFTFKVNDLIDVRSLPVAIVSGLVGFSYASILSFVPVYAEEISLSHVVNYFFLIFAIVMIVSRPFLGRAFDEKGAKVVLIPSLFVFAIGLAALGFTRSALLLLIAGGCIGLGYGTLLPGFQTIAIQSTERNRSSHAISTFFIFYDLGIASGAYVLGLIVATYGFPYMYYISSLIVCITAFIFYSYLTAKEKNVQEDYDVGEAPSSKSS